MRRLRKMGLLFFVLFAQLQLTSLTVVVIDAHGQPERAAVVALTDPLGAELQRGSTDAMGRVQFAGLAVGRYALRTMPGNAPPFELPVTIVAALPVEMIVRVPAAISDTVLVEGTARQQPSSRGSLAGESLTRTPVRVRGRGMQDAVATLPGWSTEDNGLLHARGVDDGFLYVIDGVPVYERLDALSGFAPDLSAVSAVTVITGYVPPEFGHKAGGVIEIRSALGSPWTASGDLSVGSDALRDGSLNIGGRLRKHATIRGGVVSSRSDRFLDPVHPDNLHNRGGQSNLFGQLGWPLRDSELLTAGWGYGRARFDVPSNANQAAAGQDQRQRLGQGFFNTAWQRTWSPVTVTQAAAYHRRTTARLEGSPFDTPLEAHADRRLSRSGALVSVTRQQGSQLFKAGVEWQRLALVEAFAFAITDPDEAREAGFREEALVFTPPRPFRFAGRATPALWSFYAQDTWHVGPAVTLSGGLRYDRSKLLLDRSQWSPRVGSAVRMRERTVLRAAVSRFFQPPQPEHLLLSSSPEARALSVISVGDAEGGADVEPERQWGSEVGVGHEWARQRVRLDVAYWVRRIDNVADPNVFAGTTIIFPNAVARGRAHGVEMRLELPRQHGWSGYGNWSVASVTQTGPVTGGLFLEDEVEAIGPGVEFIPDHDQRFTAGGGVTWEPRTGAALTIAGRYETGTPVPADDDDELEDLRDEPGADRVDFANGRVKPRTVVSLMATWPLRQTTRLEVSAGVSVLNLFDARYAYNFGNPFSGTHFGAPRTMTVTLRVAAR